MSFDQQQKYSEFPIVVKETLKKIAVNILPGDGLELSTVFEITNIQTSFKKITYSFNL